MKEISCQVDWKRCKGRMLCTWWNPCPSHDCHDTVQNLSALGIMLRISISLWPFMEYKEMSEERNLMWNLFSINCVIVGFNQSWVCTSVAQISVMAYGKRAGDSLSEEQGNVLNYDYVCAVMSAWIWIQTWVQTSSLFMYSFVLWSDA